MMISLDDAGLVIYTGTFSKIIGAGLRLGWIIGPEPLIHKVSKLKPDGGTSPFASHIVAEYAPSQLEEHVKELVKVYRSRRDAMIDALEAEMPEGIDMDGAGGRLLRLADFAGRDGRGRHPAGGGGAWRGFHARHGLLPGSARAAEYPPRLLIHG